MIQKLLQFFAQLFSKELMAVTRTAKASDKKSTVGPKRTKVDRRKQPRTGESNRGKARGEENAGSADQVTPGGSEEELAMPEPIRDAGLESERVTRGTLRSRQKEILDRIGVRIERGQFDLPHLPSTSMVVMDLAANPSSEIPEIVASISSDPVLSTRLLRMANSALYATQEPVETIHEAIMRIGMRELRSLILALSMRQVLFRNGSLTAYAEETWRQAYSVAVISRSISSICGMPADKLFLLGLLHDVGKIALLSMLQREVKDVNDISPTLVGRAFLDYHESTGSLMAEGWKLSEEFVSVAGNHHDYQNNEEHGRSAAVVSLAHRLDMNLSGGNAGVYWQQSTYPEMEYLGLGPDAQSLVISTAHEAFLENLEDGASQAA